MNKKIYIERETFESNDKTYFAYFIKGNLRGHDVKVSIAPPNKETDKGGYSVFDIVFGDASTAELTVTPFEMKEEGSNKVIKGNTYGMKSIDDDGKVYECTIKPSRSSDKALLNMLLNN